MTIVKKYGNRRLYDSARSRYINLDELAGMIRQGEELQIVDARTGEDLTREVLLQVVLEVLQGGEFFPTAMLRRIIRASGDDPGQVLLRKQMIAGMELLAGQLDRLEQLLAGAGAGFPSGGFPGAGFPGSGFSGAGFPGAGFPGAGFPGAGFTNPFTPPPASAQKAPEPAPEPEPEAEADVDALRARLDELEKRLKQR